MRDMGRKVKYTLQREANVTYRVDSAGKIFGPLAGSSMDWMMGAEAAKIPFAFGVELRDKGKHGFLIPPKEIFPTVKDAWIINRVLAKEVLKKIGNI